jgi:hypothetical protein
MNRTLNPRLFVVLALFACLLCAGAAPAAAAWGTVDVRLLLIFHPDMAAYDYLNGRFIKAQATGKADADLQIEMNRLLEAKTPELEELKAVEAGYLNARSQVFLNREAVMQKILAPGLSETEQNQRHMQKAKEKPISVEVIKKLDIEKLPQLDQYKAPTLEDRTHVVIELEEVTKKHLQAIDKKIAETRDKIGALHDAIYAPVFFTVAESEQKLKTIKSALLELVRQTAAEKNVTTVMDTSYATTPVQPQGKHIPVHPDTPHLMASSIFHQLANWENPAAAPGAFDGCGKPIPQSHIQAPREANCIEQLKRYQDYRHYLPQQVARLHLGSMFLIGGRNLTAEVAKKVFAKYAIPAGLQASYLEVIRSYEQTEKELTLPPAPPAPAKKGK